MKYNDINQGSKCCCAMYIKEKTMVPQGKVSALRELSPPTIAFTGNVTVWAKTQLFQVSFALDAAVKVTENFEQYFGIEFPLPKQGKYNC